MLKVNELVVNHSVSNMDVRGREALNSETWIPFSILSALISIGGPFN